MVGFLGCIFIILNDLGLNLNIGTRKNKSKSTAIFNRDIINY